MTNMLFWTTWMMSFVGGVVCLGAAMDTPRLRFFWLCCSYFLMASGVIGSLIGVPL